jgi:hypothetical protein
VRAIPLPFLNPLPNSAKGQKQTPRALAHPRILLNRKSASEFHSTYLSTGHQQTPQATMTRSTRALLRKQLPPLERWERRSRGAPRHSTNQDSRMVGATCWNFGISCSPEICFWPQVQRNHASRRLFCRPQRSCRGSLSRGQCAGLALRWRESAVPACFDHRRLRPSRAI